MQVEELYRRRNEVQLVDVREPEEWQAVRIDSARHIPMAEVPTRLTELDATRPVVTVCRSGHRSGQAAEFLRQQGYSAENTDGGMQAWQEAALPFTTPDGKPGRVV
jgi:rhodanese-related sulfurtransferase